MSNPSDWMRFYQRNFAGQGVPPAMSDQVSDATAVTTTATSVSTVTQNPTGSSNSSTNSSTMALNPEGRVSRPNRRRSRASRRAPTTLLNTDTTNFRAMVQQFTGIPSTPFSAGSQVGTFNFNFGVDNRSYDSITTTATMTIPTGYNHHYIQQQLQQQHQQQQQPQQQYMFSNINSSDDAFIHQYNNPRANMAVSDDFLVEHFLPRAS
nr:TPA_asm: hypothetical protein HUJ06_002245 [Nelumbo nucifera]